MSNKKDTKLSRAWCYTLNNYTDDDIIKLESLDSLVHICARERGENGTPHLQGYIRWKKPQRFSWWKNQFPRAHVEIRRGSEDQAVAYCRKDGDLVIEKVPETPEESSCKKTRTQETCDDVCDMLESGRTMREIYMAHRSFYFFHRRHIRAIKEDLRVWEQDPSGCADL